MRNRQTEKPQHNSPTPFDNQPKRRLNNKTKLILIIAGVVLLLGAGTALAWPTISGWFGVNKSAGEDKPGPVEIDEKTKRYLAIQDEAIDLSEEKGNEAARVYVDEQIAATEDEGEKAALLVYKSTISSDVPGGPIQFALEAEELSPSYESASALSSYYQLEGDTANALKYAKLMLERATPDFPETYPDDYAALQKRIAYLEAQL